MKSVTFYEVCEFFDDKEPERLQMFANFEVAKRLLEFTRRCYPASRRFDILTVPTADGPISRFLDFIEKKNLTEKVIQRRLERWNMNQRTLTLTA